MIRELSFLMAHMALGSCKISGTTLVLLATDAFKKYVAQIPKAVVDPSTSFVRFPKASLKKVPNITVKVSTGSMVLRRCECSQSCISKITTHEA